MLLKFLVDKKMEKQILFADLLYLFNNNFPYSY